jgi:uncharacterized protein (DUF952 family)
MSVTAFAVVRRELAHHLAGMVEWKPHLGEFRQYQCASDARLTDGDMAACLFEATGDPAWVRVATDVVRTTGRIVLVGWSHGPIRGGHVDLDAQRGRSGREPREQAGSGPLPRYAGRMPRINRITTAHAWAVARCAGSYAESTNGLSLAKVGFIHSSYAHQVTRVADALYRGVSGLVLLLIDPARLTAELRGEDLDGHGKFYPGIYGPLNLDAVVEALSFESAKDGTSRLPAALGAET